MTESDSFDYEDIYNKDDDMEEKKGRRRVGKKRIYGKLSRVNALFEGIYLED